MRKCLEVLDTTELNPEAIDLLNKSWAALMIAAADQGEVGADKNQLVFFKTKTDEKGNVILELSKAKMDEGQQITFDKFVTSCKKGDICAVSSEDTCIEKYKEIRKILGYED